MRRSTTLEPNKSHQLFSGLPTEMRILTLIRSRGAVVLSLSAASGFLMTVTPTPNQWEFQ